MPDPFTIIGTTSAVISFVDFIGKAITVARELHAAQETTLEHEVTADIRSSLESVETEIAAKERSGLTVSASESSLRNVLLQCAEVEEKLRKLAKPPKKATPNASVTDRLAYRFRLAGASVRIVLKKSDADALESEFHRCTTLLNTHLMAISRSDILAKIEGLITEDLPKKLEEIQGSHGTTLGGLMVRTNELQRTIETWASRSQEETERRETDLKAIKDHLQALYTQWAMSVQPIAYKQILDGIRFSDMLSRPDQIDNLGRTKGTFEWMVTKGEVPESHPTTLSMSFRHWLAGGDGIFHIAGKPASGKSTLMRLIAGHPETTALLEGWQGEFNARVPVVVAAFLWNAGSKRQKSMDGLYRTLLHGILDQRREDLIPLLFRDRLEQMMNLSLLDPKCGEGRRISDSEVEEKFLELIGNPPSKYRFCLFIDGADEFADPDVQKWQLAKKLKGWCVAESSVKICVSSREEEPWSSSFPVEQRLRLHFTTKPDVRKTIERAISEHHNFLRFETEQASHFIDDFVDTAEGVFLWVRLVLPQVVQLLDYGKDIHDLHQAMERFPKELQDLYESILSRVHDKDARMILKIMVTASKFWANPRVLSIIHYSFVQDARPGSPCSRGLTMEESSLEWGDKAKNRVDDFKKSMPLLFGGLVDYTFETRKLSRSIGDGSLTKRYMSNSLGFAHRTVYQYLEKHIEVDVFQAKVTVLQCLVAQARMFWDKDSHLLMGDILLVVIQWIMSEPSNPGEIICFLWLEELDKVFLQQQMEPGRKPELDPFLYGGPVSVFALCVTRGFRAYIDWAIGRSPWCLETVNGQKAMIDLLHYELKVKHLQPLDFADMLRLLLKESPEWRGLDPNSVFELRGGPLVSIWQNILSRSIKDATIFKHNEPLWQMLVILLEHGARPDVQMSWKIIKSNTRHSQVYNAEKGDSGSSAVEGDDYREEIDFDPEAQLDLERHRLYISDVKMSLPQGWAGKEEVYFRDEVYLKPRVAFNIAKRLPRGGSLRDIFVHFGPTNRPDILRLLPDAPAESVKSVEPVEPVQGIKRWTLGFYFLFLFAGLLFMGFCALRLCPSSGALSLVPYFSFKG